MGAYLSQKIQSMHKLIKSPLQIPSQEPDDEEASNLGEDWTAYKRKGPKKLLKDLWANRTTVRTATQAMLYSWSSEGKRSSYWKYNFHH